MSTSTAKNVPKRASKEKSTPVRTTTVKTPLKKTVDKKKVLEDEATKKPPSRELLKPATNSTKSTKKATPASSRIQRTQYFPSKNLYSNALKTEEMQKKLATQPSEPKNKPATSKESKAKVAEPAPSSMERPRTATLQRGSIVNANIVGPEAPDEYESDFEAASSSSSSSPILSASTASAGELSEQLQPPPRDTASAGERKLDSGTYELAESKHKQIIRYIEDTIQEDKKKKSHSSLSDEGFESLQFINFADARRKCESSARRRRGEELMKMIKLDEVSCTVFDSPAVPYEEFIAYYGGGNRVQVSSQTGHDDADEEVQTDDIRTDAKWTQIPCRFSGFDSSQEGFWKRYKNESVGCGDICREDSEVDEKRLATFLKQAADVVEGLLMEENSKLEGMNGESLLPFSKGCLQLLHYDNGSVIAIKIHPSNWKKLLTCHRSENKCLVYLWHLDLLDRPAIVLETYGEVSCLAFYMDFVIAGQRDG